MTAFHAFTGTDHPPLGSEDVHVWCVRLDVSASESLSCWSALEEGERTRAERLRLAHHRRRFVVARGLLRVTLGGYLGLSPSALRFRYAPGGRPELSPAAARPRPRFNVTHSGEVALFAVTGGRAVGVDVECLRGTDVRIETVVSQFFPARERAILWGLPPAQRRRGMWRAWTRKEACWKARGSGLSSVLGAREAATGTSEEAWSILDLPLGAGYVGAVAVQCRAPRLRLLNPRCVEGPTVTMA